MRLVPFCTYAMERYKREQEQECRNDYNSMMLLFIAQPTRENPQALTPYKKLFDGKSQKVKKPDTGRDILNDLINAW